MAKGLLTVDNILLLGVAGGGAAYFFDIGGAKAAIDAAIAELMNALKLPGGGGGGAVDCTANPTDPTCLGGGGGTGCDDPLCTSECCKCKCKDRTNCPEGTCCDKCKDECPAQCGSQNTTPSALDTVPDNLDTVVDYQPVEEMGPSGLGPYSFGGYNYPDEQSFLTNDFYPVETSVSGFRMPMQEYLLPIPRSNTTMHSRNTYRKDFDGIRYRFG